MNHRLPSSGWIVTILSLVVPALIGFSSSPQLLMPTPNIYASGELDPFEGVPTELKNSSVGVLYFTDRVPETSSQGSAKYGYRRSRSSAFGISELKIGQNVSWEQLDKASRSSLRSVLLPVHVARTLELGRSPATPPKMTDPAATKPATTEPDIATTEE